MQDSKPFFAVEIPRGSIIKIEAQLKEGKLHYEQNRILKFPNIENYGTIVHSKIQGENDFYDGFLLVDYPVNSQTEVPLSELILIGDLYYMDTNQEDRKALYTLKKNIEPENILKSIYYFRMMVPLIYNYLIGYKESSKKQNTNSVLEMNLVEQMFTYPGDTQKLNPAFSWASAHFSGLCKVHFHTSTELLKIVEKRMF